MNRARMLRVCAAAPIGVPCAVVAQGLSKVRVGVLASEAGAEGIYAQERGFFRAAGIDAELVMLANGGTVATAVIGGSIEVGVANAASTASAHVRGIPLAFVAPSAVYNSATATTFVVANKDFPFKTPADLNGKTVGVVALRDLAQVSAQKWIDDAGGNSRSVQFLELRPPELVPSVKARRIDAAVVLEPFVTQARDDIALLGKPYDALAKQLLIGGWVANKAWVDANAGLAARFVRAMRETADWANGHAHETAAILGGVTKIPLEAIEKMSRLSYGLTLDAALVQPVIDAMAQYGYLPKGFPAAEIFTAPR